MNKECIHHSMTSSLEKAHRPDCISKKIELVPASNFIKFGRIFSHVILLIQIKADLFQQIVQVPLTFVGQQLSMFYSKLIE